MELSNVEMAIVIKNMAREIVRRTTAQNAMRGAEVTVKTDDGKTVTWQTDINGTDEEIKAYFRPGKRVNIGDGPRDRMATIKSVKVLNAAARNAVKTKSASKVLQLMDRDYSYQDAIKKVSAEDGISSAQLEKECEPFI